MTRFLVAIALTCALSAAVVASPASSASGKCRGYGISGGHVKSMSVKGTSCRTGKRIVRKLYRGENDGFRGNIVFVEHWRCRSNTGLTTCWRGRRTISAQYVLY